MPIDSNTKLYGVLGDPVRHSLSPQMHNAVYEHQKINAVYLAFPVPPDRLGEFINGAKTTDTVGGINLTIPHKYEVPRYLDEIDPRAEVLQAVNTVRFDQGKTVGYNTDGTGYVTSLEREYPDFRWPGANVVMAGAGGAARAIGAAVTERGAGLTVMNRTAAKAKQLANQLSSVYGQAVHTAAMDDRETLAAADLFINTTSVGLEAPDACPITVDFFSRAGIIVSDIVYRPLRTCLLRRAAAAGMRTLAGWGMLVYQGAEAHEIWFGRSGDAELMSRILLTELQRREHRE